MRRGLLAAAAGILLAGCVNFGPREPQRYYLLEDPGAAAAGAKEARAAALLLAPTTASSFYDTQAIAYSRAPGMRAYYQYHSWTEPPGGRVGELLAARLRASGAFRTVAGITSPVRSELLLATHLAELYHDAAAAPGVARVALTAELTDRARGALVARRSFSASAPAPSYDAQGAVQACNQALARLFDEVVAWAISASGRPE